MLLQRRKDLVLAHWAGHILPSLDASSEFTEAGCLEGTAFCVTSTVKLAFAQQGGPHSYEDSGFLRHDRPALMSERAEGVPATFNIDFRNQNCLDSSYPIPLVDP